MSQIAAVAAANTIPQAALPLIEAAAIPQRQSNTSSLSSLQDTVSISSEAKGLQASDN